MEVWQGLALLSEAILQGQALLANSSQTSEALQLHVDKAVSGLRSLTSLLRALGAQVRVGPSLALVFALSVKWENGPAKESLLQFCPKFPLLPGSPLVTSCSLLGRREPSPFQTQPPLQPRSERSLLILCANFSESTPISCGES